MKVKTPEMLVWPFLLATLFSDQITKYLVENHLALYDSIEILDGFLRLTHVKNTGAAFGIFQQATGLLVIVTGVMIVVIGVAAYIFANRSPFFAVGFGLILGGAMGNFIDRLRMGYVVDFFHLSFWPAVFNVADLSVVVGAISLGYGLLFAGSHRGDPTGKRLETRHFLEGEAQGEDFPLYDPTGNQRRAGHGQRDDQEAQLPLETGRTDHCDDSNTRTNGGAT